MFEIKKPWDFKKNAISHFNFRLFILFKICFINKSIVQYITIKVNSIWKHFLFWRSSVFISMSFAWIFFFCLVCKSSCFLSLTSLHRSITKYKLWTDKYTRNIWVWLPNFVNETKMSCLQGRFFTFFILPKKWFKVDWGWIKRWQWF